MDSLFDNIVEDMKSDNFKVGDKYKQKKDELGNVSTYMYLSQLIYLPIPSIYLYF